MSDLEKCQVCDGFFPSNAYGEIRRTTVYGKNGEIIFSCGTGCAMSFLSSLEEKSTKDSPNKNKGNKKSWFRRIFKKKKKKNNNYSQNPLFKIV